MSCSLVIDSKVINLKAISSLLAAVIFISFSVLIILLNLLSIITGWHMNTVKISMGKVIGFAIAPA